MISLIITEDSCIDAKEEFDIVDAELKTKDSSSAEYMALSIESQRFTDELNKCVKALAKYNQQL